MFCLTGDTVVKTTNGNESLRELELSNQPVQFYQYDENGNIVISDYAYVKETKLVDRLLKFTMEDGSVIKCTPEHKFLVNTSNGTTYKEAKNLDENDDLVSIY